MNKRLSWRMQWMDDIYGGCVMNVYVHYTCNESMIFMEHATNKCCFNDVYVTGNGWMMFM